MVKEDMMAEGEETVTVYLPKGVLDQVLRDKSLWDERDIWKHHENPDKYPHPPKSKVIGKLVILHANRLKKPRSSSKPDDLF